MAQHITFIFVPGFWEGPQAWDGIRRILSPRYETHAPVFLSTGHSIRSGPPVWPTVMDDVAAVQQCIASVVNQGKSVIVVSHSGGGIVGSAAVEGLTKGEREAAGKPGGVVRSAFIAAPIHFEADDFPFCDWQDAEKRAHLPKDPRHSLWNDVEDDAKAKAYSERLSIQAGVGWGSKVPEWYGWREGGLPASYLVCTRDALYPVVIQESMAEKSKGDVSRLDAGHMAPLTRPEEVAKWLEEVAAKV